MLQICEIDRTFFSKFGICFLSSCCTRNYGKLTLADRQLLDAAALGIEIASPLYLQEWQAPLDEFRARREKYLLYTAQPFH